MTGTVVAAVVAAVALCSGAGVAESGTGPAAAPSGHAAVTTADHRFDAPLTAVWRPR